MNGSNQRSQGNSWMNHPDLKNMDPVKLQILQSIAEQGSQKGMQELLPFLMAATNKGKAKGVSFTPSEVDTIVEVLKMGKSPAELARINKMLQLIRTLR